MARVRAGRPYLLHRLLAYQAPAVRASGATTNHAMALAASSAARGSLRDDRDVLAANPVLK